MPRREQDDHSPGKPLSAHEAGKLAAHQPKRSVRYSDEPAGSAFDTLTAREAELLAEIADAKSDQEIATDKKISVATVQKHIENLYPKLGVQNRTAAAVRFLKRQLEKRERRIAELEAALAAARAERS